MNKTLPLSQADEESLLAHVAALPLRDQALILAGLRTGLRITEVLSLNVGDVWRQGTVPSAVRIERRALKGGRSLHRRRIRSRIIPITPTLGLAISAYLAERAEGGVLDPSGPLFLSREGLGRLSRWQALRIVRGAILASGCDSHGCWGTHSLRKTFAGRVYRLTRHDVNLTRHLLGHTQLETTLRYLGVDETAGRAAVLQLG
jgi:integrase